MDRIKVLCPQCQTPFKQPAKSLRNGYQAQCPNCMKLLTFDTASQHSSLRRALQDAKRMRQLLHAEAQVQLR